MTRIPYGSTGYYALRWFILRRDEFTCQYCGQQAPNVKLEVDHIVPISEGGTNEPDNLKTSCWACNKGKASLSIMINRRKTPGNLVRTIPSIRLGDTITQRLLEHLKNSDGGSSVKQLSQSLNINKRYCWSLLSRLKVRGQALNKSKGLWQRNNGDNTLLRKE